MTTLTTRRFLIAATAAGLFTAAHSASAANLLSNPGFEADDTSGGDVFGPADWATFNDVFASSMSAPARTGSNVMKTFGPFGTPGGGAGAVQSVGAAMEGDTYNASIYAQNWSGDPLGVGNFAVIKVEFLDASSGVLAAFESDQITSALTPDTWTEFTATGTAPAGTVSAQMVIVHVQDPNGEGVTGGAVFFDDASFELATVLVPGDADGDGDVDDTDLGIAISNFTGPIGAAGGKTVADGDTDGDGDVDDTDLGVAISGFTGPLSPAAVPEPTSFALLTLGGLLAARRRRG